MDLTIRTHLSRSTNTIADSSVAVLVWIANCDDQISDSEAQLISLFINDENPAPYISYFRKLIDNSAPAELGEMLGKFLILDLDRKKQFLAVAIQMAIADGRLSISENIILRLISDVLFGSGQVLNTLYMQISETQLPPVADPSSLDWWEQKESSRKNYDSDQNSSNSSGNERAQSTNQISHSEALNILGLDKGASSQEVRLAYKRLAKLHHPDKFHSHGEESVNAANIIFRRINEAYEVLSK